MKIIWVNRTQHSHNKQDLYWTARRLAGSGYELVSSSVPLSARGYPACVKGPLKLWQRQAFQAFPYYCTAYTDLTRASFCLEIL